MNEIDALRDSSANYVGDLESLIETLDAEAALADSALADVVNNATQGDAEEHAAAIAAQLSGLQAELEREQSLEQQLTSQRDITWGAFQALAQKETELKNAAQTTSQVTLASLAIPPQEPASRGTLINTLIAGLFGAFLGTVWVIGREWWSSANTDQDSK